MSTIESQSSSAFSHSNLIKVGLFCQYIHDNWLPETRLTLWSLNFCGDSLTFSFESPTGMFYVEIDIESVNTDSIGDTQVSIYEANLVDNIPLRHIVGNWPKVSGETLSSFDTLLGGCNPSTDDGKLCVTSVSSKLC